MVALVRPFSAAKARARSSMAGVMSMPSARRATWANAQTTSPPPHATSSTVSSGPAPQASTSRRMASSLAMVFAVENGVAWRVN